MNRQTLSSIVKLFAISTNKNDDKDTRKIVAKFAHFLSETIENRYVDEYLTNFENALDEFASFSSKRLSLNSVRLIKICSETCESLSPDERMLVLFYLTKLLQYSFDNQSVEFVNLVAEIYEILPEKRDDIINIFSENPSNCHKIHHEGKQVGIFAILSENLVAIKTFGNEITINGQIPSDNIEIIGLNSVVEIENRRKMYLNDFVSLSNSDSNSKNFSVLINNLSVKRKNKILLQEFSISINSGELVGVMGRSGSGKTTLLKAIAGLDKSFSGTVCKHSANGNSEFTKSYLPQANALIPLFSVREHLLQRIDFLQNTENKDFVVNDILAQVELSEFAENIVAKSDGSPWQISGGQQKRLGIAMEMLANPEVLILDEPTSGLSSNDSHSIVALLRKITRKQKIVIASIHQPDYETFTMFDKILIIDDGGFPIFYGSPTASADYFRKLTGKIDKESLLETHFNPGVILDIITETNSAGKRIISPKQWYEKWISQDEVFKNQPVEKILPLPKNKINVFKSFLSQLKFSFACDLKNKLQMLMLIFIAPIMSVLMSLLTRFSHSENYAYFSNPNIPAWMMMLLITAFFLGLVISGHEFIFLRQFHRNEHIIRNKTLSLTFAKIAKYIFHSAIISVLLILPATLIVECSFLFAKLFVVSWLLVFCGSLISMIMSLFFRNVSTVYLLIPIIIIPQMIFSGGLVQYENFNKHFVKDDGMPIFANLMPIRWADEACMTEAFMQNPVEKEILSEKINFYNAVKENNLKQKQLSQAKIDKILSQIPDYDSIYKHYGNMYISKIVTTAKPQKAISNDKEITYSIPPIYDIQQDKSIFLCGHKTIMNQTITTFDYNVLVMLIFNFVLCLFLLCVAKVDV